MRDSGAKASESYSALAIAIHWIVALCVLAQIPIGIVMARLEQGVAQDRLLVIHATIGALIFALTIVWLALKAAGRMPSPAAILTPFERVASRAAHSTLYLLLLITPIIGWLGVNASSDDVETLAALALAGVATDDALSDEIFAVHLACAILITLVVVAHLLGAIVHGLRRDGVNARMSLRASR